MMSQTKSDRTGVVIPPPLLFLGPFLIGWLIDRWVDWQLLENARWALVLGAILVMAGIGVGGGGVWQFRRAQTTVLPFGGTARIVEAGIYRWTRNPMYVGMALAYVGFSFLINSAWCLGLLPLSILLVQLLVIRREERYLTNKFGAVYEGYRSRVRRWL
jgi:protein-S-isoprenylcysteine O-methyltransferase Ste14